jgi:L-ascorbate metabolism protein UlaG (beta-lactamase superfamily)
MRILGRQAKGERLERMKAAPSWVDGSFHNIHPMLPNLRHGPLPTVTEFLCSGERRVPPAPLPSLDPRAGWARPVETGLRATWLGHSTVLLEIDGARVLTDPVWGERVSPLGFVGPKRFQPVPIAIAALPELDAVIISHDHYDHLDYPTIRELAATTDVPFVTSLGVGAHLEAWGVPAERIIELDWWDSWDHPRKALTLTATPSQHFSGRVPGKRNPTLWSSFVARGARHAVFFSGDTGLTTQYAEIRAKLGPFDLIMLEVGAYHASWGDIHLGPDNALAALALLGGGALLPVHWGTFSLAVHDWDFPVERLLELAPRDDVQLVMPRLGEVVEPARVERVETWWRDDGMREPAKVVESEEANPANPDEPMMEWPLD